MVHEIEVLCLSAAAIGLVHTLLGPDHYLPFIMLSRAQGWSLAKTVRVTLLCGAGHVASSVLLGCVGAAAGLAITRLEAIETIRGGLAAWVLAGFGFAYMLWGIRAAYRNRPHTHWHAHEAGAVHTHEHVHDPAHAHVHGNVSRVTPWVLFTVFILGPCEPLIPLLMYPAAQHSVWGVACVTAVFGLVTLAAMTAAVLVALRGASLVRLGALERYTHALAGATLCAAGLSMRFLGL
ncbi:MAG: sulfite exporter TauE/SafE family protein [Candidatus Hydrogenedentes bacterium]|nr:sulfite exporter TauE/SafE family protein [Candidatus Hydrogenedentota bacterium]